MKDSDYEQLNDAVNKVYLDGRYHSSPVYLDLEDNILHELSEILSVDTDDVEALIGKRVRNTLRLDETNIYSWHLEKARKWRESDYDAAPPFSALLLTLSIAAERMRQGENYSAINYYQRLCETLGISKENQKFKVRHAGKYTLFFWKSLNQWLMDNDYAYGRPTASQVNKWTYVSYALSQSLVRDADRKRLHRLFHDFGLSSHEKLGESEIRLYLNEWMVGPGPSTWLKKIWAVNDLRDRVVTAALNELDSWEELATDNGGTSPIARRLTWAAVLKKFPKKRFRLCLVTNAGSEYEGIALRIQQGSRELSKQILDDGNDFYLSPFPGTELAQLEPVEKLNLDALMLAPFELENEQATRHYKHEVRGIIPLLKQEGSPYHREVSRITLYSKHLVLCHENWRSTVEDYLSHHSNPGFTVTESTPGLPSQWVLFENVELVATPGEEISNNLQPLVPLPEGASILFTGGLKLAPSIWHAKAVPEVVASDEEGLLDIELRVDDFGRKGKVLCETNVSSYDPGFISLCNLLLDSTNLVVIASRDKKQKSSTSISFRSAETPRKLIPDRDVELHFSLHETQRRGWGLSASPDNEPTSDHVAIKGMVVSGNHDPVDDYTLPGQHAITGITDSEDDEWREYKSYVVEGIDASCILRGYDIWRVAEDSSCMTCKDCHAFQIVPPRKIRRKAGRHANANRESPSTRENIHAAAMERRTTGSVTPDVVYDALCYLGAGRWSGLQSLLSSLVELPWEVSVIQRQLVDLGLVDIMLDIDNLRPTHWCITPTALVITPSNHAFLTGFRNDSLLDNVKEELGSAGCTYQNTLNDLAPSTHLWDLGSANREMIEEKLLEIACPRGNPVEVIDSPARTIISAMPSTREMEQHLRPIHVEDNVDIERFNPISGKWQSAKMDDHGAYRTYFAGRKYFYRDGDGNSKEGDLGLVKILAARDAGVHLHGYDTTSGYFECVIGCEPPGLYRRALVSCTGALPKRENGKLRYAGIPERLAAHLMHKLYK